MTVVRPALATLMRNRTPVARVGRNKDSRRPNASAADLKKKQGDLFTQAVLVEDQFFVADTRRELFRSFIDLDPYIDIHERVTTARTGLSADVRQGRARLTGMQIISDDQIAAATAAVQGTDQDLQTAKAFEASLRDLVGHARAWEQFEATKRRIQGELQAACSSVTWGINSSTLMNEGFFSGDMADGGNRGGVAYSASAALPRCCR